MKYISREPKIIEAIQWFPGIIIPGVINHIESGTNIGYCEVVTIQKQKVIVHPGEWIITESDGTHHYPCDPKVFEETYEPFEGYKPTVVIKIEDYIDLLIDQEKLSRLEEGVVDNWQWYSESLKIRGSLDEWIKELKEKFK